MLKGKPMNQLKKYISSRYIYEEFIIIIHRGERLLINSETNFYLK